MAEKSIFVRVLLPVLLVAAAIAVAVMLVIARREPPRAPAAQRRPLVEAIVVNPEAHQLTLSVYGSVAAAREVRIVPQVTGRIVWVNASFIPGGVVRENEALFVIDSSDYVVAVREARSALQEAQARLRQELGQRKIAEREWELFGDQIDTAAANRSLALREPQLSSARARVSAAQAGLRRARLNVKRTRVRAPFNGFVLEENADIGQLVGPQAQAGVLVGADRFWVRVSLPEEMLPYLAIPGINADTGSAALIRHSVGDRTIERRGRIEKLAGDLEPTGRMARLLVSIDDPMGLRDVPDTSGSFFPLLLGAFVEVIIQGPRQDGLYALPRTALRDGDQAYLVGPDSSLRITRPHIFWRGEDSVFVDRGLSPGDRVITSPLSAPVEGMALQLRAATQEDDDQPSGDGGADEGARR